MCDRVVLYSPLLICTAFCQNLGDSWTTPAPYITGPGAFPRNRLIPTLSNKILFPIYNASSASPKFQANYAVMAMLSHSLAFELDAVPGSANLVQPTVVRPVPGKGDLVCFLRDRRAQHVYRMTSSDDGANWTVGVRGGLVGHRLTCAVNPTADTRRHNSAQQQCRH